MSNETRPCAADVRDPARASIRYGAALLLVKATPVSWQTCKSPFPTNHACPHGHDHMWLKTSLQKLSQGRECCWRHVKP